MKSLLAAIALIFAPSQALALTVLPPDTPHFTDGMQLTAERGAASKFQFLLDPCDGVGANCHVRAPYTDAFIAQADGFGWPEAPVADGVGWQCDNDLLCIELYFEPQTTGSWDLSFTNSYQSWTYLGGDVYGPEIIIPQTRLATRSFTVTFADPVIPVTPVPLPAAAPLLAIGLAALALVRRQTQGLPIRALS